MSRRSLLAVLVGLAAAAAAPAARADEESTPPRASVASRVGVARAEQLLGSEVLEAELRGIARLGATGTRRAITALAALVESGVPGGAHGRLAIVRALAPHAADPVALRALVRVMTADGSTGPDDELAPWSRASAALALALADRREAWEALRQAVATEGPLGQIAADAVLAHPPRDLGAFLGSRVPDSVRLVETLGALADQRAFLAVRAAVTAGPPEVRARAAVVLTRLGAFETVPLARHWLAEEQSPTFRVAAAEILQLARAPEAPIAVANLAEAAPTFGYWLDLVRAAPHPTQAPALIAALRRATVEDRSAVFAALGQAGGAPAAAALRAALGESSSASDAAYALALSGDDRSDETIAQALERTATRRLAARAAVVGTVARGKRFRHLPAALARLLASDAPSDRAVGAWGLTTLDEERGVELLGSDDPVVVLAAARAAFTPKLAAASAARLEKEPDPRLRAALAMALASGAGRARASTATLVTLIGDGGAAAPLAARELAARTDPAAREQVERLLASGVADVRAHAALGLGDSALASAVGRLERAYLFEPDARVRRAIVIGLGRRMEPARRRPLELAAALDGAPAVRAAARAGLAGQPSSLQPSGRGTVWVSVHRPDGAAAAGTALAIEVANGLVLPAAADPDGLVTLVGVCEGAVRLRLAEPPRRDNPGPHDDPQGARSPRARTKP